MNPNTSERSKLINFFCRRSKYERKVGLYEPLHKIRFTNNKATDLISGIEPLNLYYDVPPGKDIEVFFYIWKEPDKDEFYQDILVENDKIYFDMLSADVTVYLDHKKVYP